jgi:hypothetical protein
VLVQILVLDPVYSPAPDKAALKVVNADALALEQIL